MSNYGDSPDIGDSPERTGINGSNNLSTSTDNEETALSKYEHELERMMSESLVNGQDLYTQKLFIGFQNAAKAVTKMFRGKSMSSPLGKRQLLTLTVPCFACLLRTIERNSQLEYVSRGSRICHHALQR